jgi:hypothetical protein
MSGNGQLGFLGLGSSPPTRPSASSAAFPLSASLAGHVDTRVVGRISGSPPIVNPYLNTTPISRSMSVTPSSVAVSLPDGIVTVPAGMAAVSKPPTRNFGQSESNKNSRVSGYRLWNGVAMNSPVLPRFEDITVVTVEGENLQNTLRLFLTYVANTPIPRYFNEDLTPKNEGNKHQLMSDSLLVYIGQVKMLFREKFPEHTAWPSRASDKIEWWDIMVASFKKVWQGRYLDEWKDDPNKTYGQQKCQPLYLKNYPNADSNDLLGMSSWYHAGKEDQEADALRILDLEFLNREYFRKATLIDPRLFTDSLMINMLRHMCGRGGEPRFMSWNSAHVNYRYQCLGMDCPSMKTLTDCKLPFVLSREFGLHCIMFQVACFIGPGKGLQRCPAQVTAGYHHHVFPALHSMKSESVSRKISTVLKAHVPVGTPKTVKDGLTSRSLRQASITEMSMNPASTPHTVCARSGHKVGNNSDKYLDPDNLKRGLVGAQILAGNEPTDCVVRFPLLSHLGIQCKPSIDRFCDIFMEGCGVEAWMPGGPLHAFSKDLVAVIIMRFLEAEEMFGPSNAFVTWMKDAAVRARLEDPQRPDLSHGVCVLELFSGKLKEHFEMINEPIHNEASLIKSMARQSELVLDLKRENYRLKESMTDFQDTMHHSINDHMSLIRKLLEKNNNVAVERNSALEHRISEQSEVVSYLQRKCAALSTPPQLQPRRSPRGKRKHDDAFVETPCTPKNDGVEHVDLVTPVALVAAKRPAAKRPLNIARIAGGTKVGAPRLDKLSITNHNTNCQIGDGFTVHNNQTTTNVTNPTRNISRVQSAYAANPLLWSNHGEGANLQDGTVGIVLYLRDLHVANFFEGSGRIPFHKIQKTRLPACMGVGWAHLLFLEMLEYMATEDDRLFLAMKAPPMLGMRQLEIYSGISDRMMDKMMRFQGRDPVAERKGKRKVSGKKLKAGVAAIARRIRDYKKVIKGVQDGDSDTFSLCEREDIKQKTPPGTPTDNTSIRSFMAKKL